MQSLKAKAVELAKSMKKKGQAMNLWVLVSVIIVLVIISFVSGIGLIVQDELMRVEGLNETTVAAINASAVQIQKLNTTWLGVIVIVIVMVILLVLLLNALGVFNRFRGAGR